MDILTQDRFTSLDVELPLWDRFFMVAPLVVIGTKEKEGYDLAPKHRAMPLGEGNYFGFICTPRHGTYQNIKETKAFTVSFPTPDQVVSTSLSASPRRKDISKSKGTVEALPIVKSVNIDAPLLRDAYLYLECELYKIIDGFDDNSIVTGTIKAAHVQNEYLRISEKDEGQQLHNNPLLAYIANGRFAKITETYHFPFPKDFKK